MHAEQFHGTLKRRSFLQLASGAGVLAGLTGLGSLGFLRGLGPVSAEEATLGAGAVQFDADIEPLVRLIEETPRERVLEEVAHKIRHGTSYREILAALFLAGVRNIQPRPVGFKFHAVLVVNSAHLASLDSSDSDRWLPIFWAIDQFKSSQAADRREGDWTLGPVDESAVPASHKARAALVTALNNWDEGAADAAIVGMARTAGADEIFEVLCRYGARDFREIGHKEIYVANSFRTLEAIGWHHAEPVLRSLVYAILDRDGARDNPSKSEYAADQPYRENVKAIKEIKPGWLDGKRDENAATEMLTLLREASPREASAKAIALLNAGISPLSLFDAYFQAAAELMMRSPGILSLHASTFTNALHYSWQHCRDEETRKMLIVQNASFLPLFRGRTQNGPEINTFDAASVEAGGVEAVDEIFAEISRDRMLAARKMLGYLERNPDPRPIAQAARRLIFLKGTNSHDYKYSSAVLEDYSHLSGAVRNRFLAAAAFNLRGSDDSENELVKRTRAALEA